MTTTKELCDKVIKESEQRPWILQCCYENINHRFYDQYLHNGCIEINRTNVSPFKINEG